jgi:hypothetical protein
MLLNLVRTQVPRYVLHAQYATALYECTYVYTLVHKYRYTYYTYMCTHSRVHVVGSGQTKTALQWLRALQPFQMATEGDDVPLTDDTVSNFAGYGCSGDYLAFRVALHTPTLWICLVGTS